MKQMYPSCAKTFKEWCHLNPQYTNTFQKIGKPLLFDVSLRDGIQALTKKEQEQFTLKEKLKFYELIKTNYEPTNIEIGSIVNEKVLPVFKDSLEFLSLITMNSQLEDEEQEQVINKYILIPNKEKLQSIVSNKNVNHISFISSVSNSFQLKNTRRTLEQSDKEICEMLHLLSNTYKTDPPKVKLYVSCINECPIAGSIDNDFIVNRLLTLHKLKIDKICISDTCGSLKPDDFEYIIDTCKYFGLPMSQLSLHLHVEKGYENITESIIHMALDRNIKDFDVSLLETGGCSVTMSANKLNSNLSYELFYKSLCTYIIKKTNRI